MSRTEQGLQVRRKYNRDWYHKNKAIVNPRRYQRTAARRQDLQAKIMMMKQASGCVRCGFSNPIALQFHHRNPLSKSFNIADSLSIGVSWEKIQEEISKCDVLCANCHAIETNEQ